ncbi:GNAT family N-acetyltransferase [Streptomyces calidiresistens]|uniref:GNAT family N-acetyltransferase n=1 Tax=Streptomyces calidiresistens TaxID=1485586 RepID=A0A7W3T4D1_9ACTN|nr:GNAT family N-acetyltransferase [Streptomyces calidiresistens]MBB0230714.1 GNAT family N-acetyltransferase [Streptomyces calidiresistens]
MASDSPVQTPTAAAAPDPDIRAVGGDADLFAQWLVGVRTGFNVPPGGDPKEAPDRFAGMDLSRTRGVFDEGRCVATFRSFDQELTAPGGKAVRADAVTAVTVSSTHRRRGLLSRLMTEDLRAARERGDTVATLIAAEYRIYGRYGFGPAASATTLEIDTAGAGLDPRRTGRPEDLGLPGSIRFADAEEVRKIGPELHDRFRRLHPGAIDRDAFWWDRFTGVVRWSDDPPVFHHLLYTDAEGVPQGLASYTIDETWTHGRPDNLLKVRSLIGATPAAERALWHHLCCNDWVSRISTGKRYPEDPMVSLLPDPRAARITDQWDFLWVRPLDTAAMLSSRVYRTDGELVVEVRDPLGLSDGRFLLTASPEGAECVPTDRSADLTLDTGVLAGLWLGERSATLAHAAGELDEETPGAVVQADLLLGTGRRPWCPDGF